jgi:AraC-like DNA-binding protein
MAIGSGPGSAMLDSLLRALGSLGISRQDLAGAVDEREAGNPAAYLEAAAAHAGHVTIGIELAERAPIHADTALAYLMMSSPTLGAALEHMARYASTVVRRSANLTLRHDAETTSVVYGPTSGARQYSEYTAVVLLRFFRHIVGDASMQLRAVCFVHPPPADSSVHEHVFGCEVRFAQPRNALVLDRAQLLLPSAHASPSLHAVHERVVAESLPPALEDALVQELRRVVEEQLESGPPELAMMARALGTSARTLQRRLAALATDYQAVVDEARRKRTLELLMQPSLSVLAVARAVGYADANSFHRAFRRWTGMTPAAYRQSARGSETCRSTPAAAPGPAGATTTNQGSGTGGRSNQKGRPPPKSRS